jgi:hypothetical protein
MNNSKIKGLIIVLVVVLAVALGFKAWWGSRSKTKAPAAGNNQQQTQQANAPKVEKVEDSKLPTGFPADFPLEKDAKIDQNFNVTADGKTQATRKFISQKSLKENFDFYKDWLTKNGWTIITTLDIAEIKSIGATKGSNSVNISISTDPVSKKAAVDISYLTPTK